MKTSKNLILIAVLFFSPVIVGNLISAEEPTDKNLNVVTYSDVGIHILNAFHAAVVVSYEKGDPNLRGYSGNPDGKIIKTFKRIEHKKAVALKELLLDKSNFDREWGHRGDDTLANGQLRNWNQGVEFTDGNGYVRVYFSQDGKYCTFFTSSGVSSSLWVCSEKLSSYASLILKNLE